MLKKGNKLDMIMKFLNLKFFFLIFLATWIFKHAYSEENYIVNIVNNIPITKVDIYNRAKLISISINQNTNYLEKSPLLPPDFLINLISVIYADLSTALHISYIVIAATDTDVIASISTPVASFVLTVENLMLKKGYDINLLYKDNVRKAGKLIANKLGNDCTSQDFLKDQELMTTIMDILR